MGQGRYSIRDLEHLQDTSRRGRSSRRASTAEVLAERLRTGSKKPCSQPVSPRESFSSATSISPRPRAAAPAILPPPPARKKGREGAQSVRQGQRLEDWLLAQSQFLVEEVDLIYVPPRLQICGQEGAFLRCVPVASTWVDFMALWKGGSAHFEAKSTTCKSWQFDERLLGHQGEILKRQARKGKVTFVFVRHCDPHHPADYVVPFTEEGLPFSNKRSIVWHRLEAWKVPQGRCWFDAALVWDAYCTEGWAAVTAPRVI